MKISGMVAMLTISPLGGLLGAVAGGDVRDFMRHDAGQFGFGFGLQHQPGVHEEEAAGQGERVDFFGIQHLDGEGNLGVGVPHQILADAVDVFGNDRIVDDLGLALHFLRQLFAECDFLFQGVEVDAFADIAIADLFGIFFLVPGLFSLDFFGFSVFCAASLGRRPCLFYLCRRRKRPRG